MKPGTRVALRSSLSIWPEGTTGVVVPLSGGLRNGFDLAVLLDGSAGPICVNADEVRELEHLS